MVKVERRCCRAPSCVEEVILAVIEFCFGEVFSLEYQGEKSLDSYTRFPRSHGRATCVDKTYQGKGATVGQISNTTSIYTALTVNLSSKHFQSAEIS